MHQGIDGVMTAVLAAIGAFGQAVCRVCTTQRLITLRASARVSAWLLPHMPARPPVWATDLTASFPTSSITVVAGVQIEVLPSEVVFCVLVMLAEFINAMHQTITAPKHQGDFHILQNVPVQSCPCDLAADHCTYRASESHHFGT